MIGKTLGHYQITNQLGKGGMGEVYQAKDQVLGREVAIKVLPEEFAKDDDRIARFQREAKLLASLNHPNIAAIYGLEESSGTNFLVLELVEGETLADRIKQGSIPVEESLKLALQIAEALEAAHEKGIIHRDLKPSNIKVTPDNKVKVLDFGLAKAYAGEKEEINLSNSPTLSDAATQQGLILGTAAYMSPEQARGKSVDKRADIWAFGCVLFEMLAGRVAFSGKDVTDILAAVIRSEPEWDSLPGNLHWRLREVLDRCLKKDEKDRYHDISDLRVDMQKVLIDSSGALIRPIPELERRGKLRSILPWATATLVLGLIIAGLAVWKLKPSEPRQVMRFDYELPEDQQFSNLDWLSSLAVSPDGRQIVYSTTKGLYIRSVDELTAKFIPGTEGIIEQPFFSPDGKSIGYVSSRQLKKISIRGGAPVTLCSFTGTLVGASWGTDDTILFGQFPGGIMQVSANGGSPEPLTKVKALGCVGPQFLPDGKSMLYTEVAGSNSRKVIVQSLETGKAKELFAGSVLRYLPTGHIVYKLRNNSNLFAMSFDIGSLEAKGGATPIVEGVMGSQCAFSDAGTLIYIPGTTGAATPPKQTLVWVDRNGNEEPITAAPNAYGQPKISPDGTRVALAVGPLGNEDIFVWDFVRQTLTKLTFDKTREMVPIWTPDSKRIIYWSTHEDESQGGIYWRAADGSGKVEKLASATDRQLFPWSIARDGKSLFIQELVTLGNADIGALHMEGDRPRKSLLQNEYSEAMPAISPDGRWMAYCSSESTGDWMRAEVYVRPFPELETSKTQVSNGGGHSPRWSQDGKELYYITNQNDFVVVPVESEPRLTVGIPKVLFTSTYLGLTQSSGTPYDIHPNGKRFLMIKPPAPIGEESQNAAPRKINIVLNWLDELKQRVPVK